MQRLTNEEVLTFIEHAVEHVKNDLVWESGDYLVFNQTVYTLVAAHKAVGPLGEIPRKPFSDPRSREFRESCNNILKNLGF